MTTSCVRATLAILLVLTATGCRRSGERVLEIRRPGPYHVCQELSPWPAPDTLEVGSEGGTLRSGNSVLTIPAKALPGQSRRTFILSTVESREVGVEVTMSAQGRLRRTATLEIDTRCPVTAPSRTYVWRERPNPDQSQRLQTEFGQGRATVGIDTTSKFMIAN